MATFADSLKKEIARVARKELKAEISPLRKASAAYRSEIAALKRDLKRLESQNKALARQLKPGAAAAASPMIAEAKERKKPGRQVVFSAERFAAMRSKLGLSAAQMATLLGVSSLSVYKWEKGVEPRAAQRSKILALRTLGKREALKMLESAG